MSDRRRLLLASLVASLLPATALAGPPLICFPFETGGAPSLPWAGGSGWKGVRSDYGLGGLVSDTLRLLGADAPVLARMETLRRAALYATEGRSGAALAAALEERSRNARGPERALAAFDLGYGLATLAQAGALKSGTPLALPPTAYESVQEAIRAREGDPAMQYAAALISLSSRREAADEHLRRAVTGAEAGSPLARTLTAHAHLWGGALEQARASAR